MILVIDNYDSFVYNLTRYIVRLGRDCVVKRNDKITIYDIKALSPEAIIISPGPCAPKDAGISIEVIKEFGSTTPILGVCLGHQAIAEAYGGRIIRSQKPTHGKASMITHDKSALFSELPTPLQVGRYHSLVAELSIDAPIKITARCEINEIMALQHATHPVYGVQFHPESILTPNGSDLIKNFITICDAWHKNNTEQNSK